MINAVLKSGTNQIRGDVWEYFRNEALNANDYFSNQNQVRRPEYRQNQYLAGFSKITTLRNNPRIGQLALKFYF